MLFSWNFSSVVSHVAKLQHTRVSVVQPVQGHPSWFIIQRDMGEIIPGSKWPDLFKAIKRTPSTPSHAAVHNYCHKIINEFQNSSQHYERQKKITVGKSPNWGVQLVAFCLSKHQKQNMNLTPCSGIKLIITIYPHSNLATLGEMHPIREG